MATTDWQSLRWGDIVDLLYGRQLRDYHGTNGPYRVFGTNGPIGWTSSVLCNHASVIIGRKGAYRGVHYSSQPFFAIDTAFYIEPKVEIDARWAYYELLTHDINALDSGSAIPSTSRESFCALPVQLPPLSEQRAIAHILGALDDKIEINRQMNETLEAMARALFKSWFIDFDPVHAKAGGRDPGLPADIAALFPNSFEDSGLGEIPKGWAAASLGILISQRTERLRDRPAVVLSAMAAGELVSSDEHFTKRVYSQEIGKYLAVEQWDFAYNPSRINIGSIGMLKEPLLGGVSPVYVVFRPQAACRWFMEFNLGQPSTKQWINTLASGSVRQSLSYDDFASLPCVIPPETIIQRFDEVWTGLRAGILSRSDESRTLTALRDTLLPKLLSGELLVKDVRRFEETSS